MADCCTNHGYEQAVATCPDCAAPYCEECFVPPVRRRQPKRCVQCALVAAGIRTRRRGRLSA